MASADMDKLYEQASKFDFIRFTYADINGIARGRSVPVKNLKSTLANGIEGYAGQICIGPRSEISYFKKVIDEHQCNVTFYPQPDTFHPIPWSCSEQDIKVGEIFTEPKWHDGTPQGACPRFQARKQLEKFREMGYELMSSVEPEFYIMHEETFKPFRPSGEYGQNINLTHYEPLLYHLGQLLEKAGVDAGYYDMELGHGQVELPLIPKKGIAGADQIFGLKQFTKEICSTRGLIATFMSRPYLDQIGSGFHYNHSIWNLDGTNASVDTSKDDSISDVLRYWIAGILKHSRALNVLCCPTVNCYRRMHGEWAPHKANWGIKDRKTIFRVKTNRLENTHMEYRTPSAAVNPYLMIAGTLAAGMDGIQNKLEPPPQGQQYGELLPTNLEQALQAFEDDKYMCEAFGDEFVEWFLQVKREVELKKFKDWTTAPLEEMLQKEREEYLEFI